MRLQHCIFILFGFVFALSAARPIVASAQTSTGAALPTAAVEVAIHGSEVAYGDIIDFDAARNVYVLSQYADDSHVFGVAVKDPPLLYLRASTSVPVAEHGVVLVNITDEGGSIQIGDGIIASSVAGKGMRAASSSMNVLGTALEPFNGSTSSSTSLHLGSKFVRAGTIAMNLDAGGRSSSAAAFLQQLPINGEICLWACVPFGTLMRYLTAALISFGSVYLAFRTFMVEAVSGVTSIGRNPLAKSSIQSMVVFNAVLSLLLAFAGLIAGVVILFIQL